MGLATIKTFLMLLFLLKLLFPCMLRSVAFYIRYKMGNVRFRFGGRLRGLKSKLLINKMIKKNAYSL